MKNNLKISTLLVIISLLIFAFLPEATAQNIFDIRIDPKHATTAFIESKSELKVETWDEEYILLQISFEHQPQEKKVLHFLEMNKHQIVSQEFTVNDFLNLKMTDLDRFLLSGDCKPQQLFSYKIIAPKNIDLEVRCKNDLSIYNDLQESDQLDIANIRAHDEE